ncbi:MAG: IS66 family transposase [Isosphaeraceae bacterium]
MSPLESTPLTGCQECVRLRRELDAALAQIAVLQAQVKELALQIQRNSSNSSTPPSANPLDAPKPAPKPPTGRRPGGQTGHRGRHRARLPANRVDAVVTYVPSVCTDCHTPLPIEPGPNDPEPSWHQVAELPKLAAVVTEHQAHARTCPGCGRRNQATVPAEVRAHVIGPRLAAMMSYLSGRFHLSKRSVRELVEAAFEVPVSLGTVAALEQQTSVALIPAHEQARDAVRDAPVKNADETGWKQAGARRWLWTAATVTAAYFVIHVHRGARGLKALLGEAIAGIVISDRWWGYNRLPLEQRQVCWAHLKRDFRKCLERGGPGKVVGDVGLMVVEDVFTLWWEYREGLIDRPTLGTQLEPVIEELRLALERGSGCADPKVVAFCDNLLTLYPALWLFAGVEGVEPTNNHAERILRPGVLWRKNAFGCHSESGCRFVERILTVVQTLRLQKRSVLEFLEESVIAHRSGTPSPALVIPK